ncbi:hypothetical protein EU803_01690 [Loktanella sp. IMCC34160]|uniref:hypothetical protein n=1 Tax=Loktanella sp. IMCC34160 TaxID=2510646 RepID=UPI00101BA8AA|nr:hypothetical protein [Loktanella sp. IMCC34160]RYG92846.1 hypothetical protein EU803_01690 [Loktanella sp. IMCC34160]
MAVVLILGSGPNVVAARNWPKTSFDRIVAINNAWQVRPDWDDLIHPEDFPEDRHPTSFGPDQRRVTYRDYVPAQNALGGFVYAGGTMAFTAAYWALQTLRPDVIAMMGCDMVYPTTGATHFYGTGAADPLRPDPTLRNLEAKSARLLALGAAQGCALVNLSTDQSRLVFPRATVAELHRLPVVEINGAAMDAALRAEERLGYFVASGRYWEEQDRFDTAHIDHIDSLWLKAVPVPQTSP